MKVQLPDDITSLNDVESFDISREFIQSVDPALNYASAWLNDHNVPHIFITTIRIETKEDDGGAKTISSAQNIRRNNLNVVRDFALCLAHAVMTSTNHVEMGHRIAELGCSSPDFVDAFLTHLEKKGLLAEVLPGEIQSPPDPNIH